MSIGALHLGRVGQGVPQAAGDDRLDLDRLAQRAAQQLGHVADQPADRLITLGSSGWRRAKASSWRVSWRGAVGAVQGVLEPLRGRARRRPRSAASSSRLPRITCSRLLKSWATPPVSWPTASIRCAWRSRSCACSRSVMSRVEPMIRSIAAIVVPHRRQDRFPDARAAGQVDPVAGEGRRPTLHHALQMVDQRAQLWPARHLVQLHPAHHFGFRTGRPLIGRIDLGNMELAGGGHVDHREQIGCVGEDRLIARLALPLRGLCGLALGHLVLEPTIRGRHHHHQGGQADQGQPADRNGDEEADELVAVGLCRTARQQGVLRPHDLVDRKPRMVHGVLSGAGVAVAGFIDAAGAIEIDPHPGDVDALLQAIDQLRHTGGLLRVIPDQGAQLGGGRGDSGLVGVEMIQVARIARDAESPLGGFHLDGRGEKRLGGLDHVAAVADPTAFGAGDDQVVDGQEDRHRAKDHQQGDRRRKAEPLQSRRSLTHQVTTHCAAEGARPGARCSEKALWPTCPRKSEG